MAMQRFLRPVGSFIPRRTQSSLSKWHRSSEVERGEEAREHHEPVSEEVSVSGGPSSADIAMPRPGFHTPVEQAPGRSETWSQTQNPRSNAMRGPRFEQINPEYQPQPLAPIDLIAEEPVRLVESRIAVCDGGDGPLGHPKIFINLDKPGPKPCGYCGLRFDQAPHKHHH